jgi:hypothetical protein
MTLLLSFQLMLPTGTVFATTMAEQKEACAARSGMQWDSTQQRCVRTQDSQDTRDAFLECRDQSLYPTQEAMEKCIQDNATAQSKVGFQGGKDATENTTDDFWHYANDVVTATNITLMIVQKAAGSAEGECLSKKIFGATSIAATAAEIYYQIWLKNELRDIEEDYEYSDNAYDAQKEAFDFLKAEQETIKGVATKKKQAYTVASVGYGAAAALAAIESVPVLADMAGLTSCKNPNSSSDTETGTSNNEDIQRPETDQPTYEMTDRAGGDLPPDTGGQPGGQTIDLDTSKGSFDWNSSFFHNQVPSESFYPLSMNFDESSAINSLFILAEQSGLSKGELISPSIDSYHEVKKTGFLDDINPKVFAQILKFSMNLVIPEAKAVAGAAGAAGSAAAKEGSKFATFLGTSPGILILSGISLGLNLVLRQTAEDDETNAQNHIDQIDETIASFGEAVEGFCPAGRDSLDSPRCYCYTDSGKKNDNRSNSQTCLALWDKDKSLFRKGNNYNAVPPETLGCMALNGQYDQACKCKKIIDKNSGQNYCYKSNVSAFSLKGLGSGLALPQLSSYTDKISAGDYTGAGDVFTDASLNKQAARTRKIKDKMMEKLNKYRVSNGKNPVKITKKMIDGFVKKVATPKMIAKYGNQGLAGMRKVVSNNHNKIKSGALRKALKKTGLKKMAYGRSRLGVKGKKSKKGDFDFSFDSGSSSSSAPKVQQFADKNYNYKDNDIVKRESTPIWSIITHRYNTSGLRRLFEE